MASSRSSACCFSILATSGRSVSVARVGDVALVPHVRQGDVVRCQDADVGQVGRPSRSAPAATSVDRQVDALARSAGCHRPGPGSPAGPRPRRWPPGRWCRRRCTPDRPRAPGRTATDRRPEHRRPRAPRSPSATLTSSGKSPRRSFGPPRSASTAMSGPVRARAAHPLGLRARRSVRQIDPQDVDARVQQPLERARRILSRSDGGDDLRAAARQAATLPSTAGVARPEATDA